MSDILAGAPTGPIAFASDNLMLGLARA